MKIVRIIARLNVGGPARHVVWLSKELNDTEFQTELLAGTVPEGEEDMNWFAAENSVEPVFIEEMSRELSPKDVISLWKIYRALKEAKPDIVHTHTAKAGTIGRIAALLYRIFSGKKVKIVHTFHGHIFHSYYGKSKTKIFLIIEKILARLATDKIITISRLQFEEINGQFGIGEKEQFKVIPLGIDLEKFAQAKAKREVLRKEINAKNNEILVGFVGRLTEIKNVSLLLKVAALYRERTDPNLPQIRFIIIGDGNLRNELEAEAESLKLNKTVDFLGNRNDADIFYAGLDIVALVSKNEGTPLSLIEAMANEKPVISTAVGGVADLLGDTESEFDRFKVCGRGVRIDDVSAENFLDGLIYLAKNEKLQKSLAKNGKDFVKMQYGKMRLVEDIKNLYRDLIKN